MERYFKSSINVVGRWRKNRINHGRKKSTRTLILKRLVTKTSKTLILCNGYHWWVFQILAFVVFYAIWWLAVSNVPYLFQNADAKWHLY